MVLQNRLNNKQGVIKIGSSVKCFDVVSQVAEEATAQFSPLWEIDKEKYQILKQYCEVIDSLALEFDGESFDIEVDDIAMTFSIKLECVDMTIKSKTHRYYDLIQRADSFGFSATKNGNLVVEFVFPSVWRKTV